MIAKYRGEVTLSASNWNTVLFDLSDVPNLGLFAGYVINAQLFNVNNARLSAPYITTLDDRNKTIVVRLYNNESANAVASIMLSLLKL